MGLRDEAFEQRTRTLRTGSKEAGRVEVPEDGEAVDEDEYRDPERAPVGQVRLERVPVEQLLAVEALRLETAICRSYASVIASQCASATLCTHRTGCK